MSAARHRTRSIVVRVVVFLLLGAVVNVGVAWGSSRIFPAPFSHGRWNSVRSFGPSHADSLHWVVNIKEMALGTTVSSYPKSWFPPEAKEIFTGDVVDAPYWSVGRTPPTDAMTHVYREEARGWPMRSFMWRLEHRPSFVGDLDAAKAHNDGALFLDRAIATNDPAKIVPLKPIWPGFAINTFFYAVILGMLFAAPGRVRRWRRVRRGLCAKCAYPVGASDVCTECGVSVRRGMAR